MIRSQRGDTLIEVVIATVIIGTILFSAYTLTTRAFQLGQSSRERTQAAQLLQQQAEGLRSLRDHAASWDAFKAQVDGIDKSAFRIVKTAGDQWQLVSNTDGDGYWQPGCSDPCGPGQSDDIATYYRLQMNTEYEQNPSNPSEVDKVITTVRVKWPRLGGGDEETSELIIKLTDRQLPLSVGDFDKVVG